MPLFAISDVVWQTLIAAVVTIILDWRARQARDAARKVEATLETTTEETKSELADIKDGVAVVKHDIHKVEIATNSMKDALVESTEKEALARGIKEGTQTERDRPR